MKKVLSAFAGVVAMMAVGCQNQAGVSTQMLSNDSTAMSIAFVNTDSIMSNYLYAQKINGELSSKAESSQADLNQKQRVFQSDVAELQRKVQYNAISEERFQSEQRRLAQAEQDLMELNQRLSAQFAKEQAERSQELHDTLTSFLKEYAAGKYKLILATGMVNDNVMYAAEGVDITKDVTEMLNSRYEASKK